MLYSRPAAGLKQHVYGAFIITVQVPAYFRKNTARFLTCFHCVVIAATIAIHIGRWASYVADAAAKPLLLRQRVYLRQYGCFTAGLDNFSLVHGNGAKSTAAETASMAGNRAADLFPGWNRFCV